MILKYNLFINFKVFWYVRKLKKHFKIVIEDKLNEDKIENLKNISNNINKIFIKEIRKKKLKQIDY